jgi:hypothetical protein
MLTYGALIVVSIMVMTMAVMITGSRDVAAEPNPGKHIEHANQKMRKEIIGSMIDAATLRKLPLVETDVAVASCEDKDPDERGARLLVNMGAARAKSAPLSAYANGVDFMFVYAAPAVKGGACPPTGFYTIRVFANPGGDPPSACGTTQSASCAQVIDQRGVLVATLPAHLMVNAEHPKTVGADTSGGIGFHVETPFGSAWVEVDI